MRMFKKWIFTALLVFSVDTLHAASKFTKEENGASAEELKKRRADIFHAIQKGNFYSAFKLVTDFPNLPAARVEGKTAAQNAFTAGFIGPENLDDITEFFSDYPQHLIVLRSKEERQAGHRHISPLVEAIKNKKLDEAKFWFEIYKLIYLKFRLEANACRQSGCEHRQRALDFYLYIQEAQAQLQRLLDKDDPVEAGKLFDEIRKFLTDNFQFTQDTPTPDDRRNSAPAAFSSSTSTTITAPQPVVTDEEGREDNIAAPEPVVTDEEGEEDEDEDEEEGEDNSTTLQSIETDKEGGEQDSLSTSPLTNSPTSSNSNSSSSQPGYGGRRPPPLIIPPSSPTTFQKLSPRS